MSDIGNYRSKTGSISLAEYDYLLPEGMIAQYPLSERDSSKLLVYKEEAVKKDIFRNIDNYLPENSLLFFNNTRVIRARLLFRKESGAQIEIMCLEPINPPEYEKSLSSKSCLEWKCIVGNLKKWKNGKISCKIVVREDEIDLYAEKLGQIGDACRIMFSWTPADFTFGEILETIGHIPLPPYINRDDEEIDNDRYQTVYSSVKGSVAAPTAGLHFTEEVLNKIKKKGCKTGSLTLHVGAGTFQPVKSNDILNHQMHREHFYIDMKNLKLLADHTGDVIPVGTTSVRTLESLYWLGVKLINNSLNRGNKMEISQWEAYDIKKDITPKESFDALIEYMKREQLENFNASTSIIIIPGYDFRICNGIITNFHQPKSTLLLLISALIGDNWKKVYNYAQENNFRFLSYGDSSLLLK